MNPSALVCLVFLVACFSYSYSQEVGLSEDCGEVRNDIPHWERLPTGITVGSRIYVIGKPHKGAEFFQIDLEYTNDQVLTSFHMKPSFKYKSTRASSYKKGKYYRKKYHKGVFPFKYEEWFTMVIHVESKQYAVYVDGKKYFAFKPKYGYSYVNYVELKGEFSFLKPIVINP